MPALDGLRTIAVAAVLLYHADLGGFAGGFLGVDVFFVINGYLITSILLTEQDAVGRIDLFAFWRRRARRLLPALFALVAGVLAYEIAFMPAELAALRDDSAAALAYITNWYLIINERSYFEAALRPSLLQHLWSLAVEEQFYLLWPLALVALLRWARRYAVALVSAGVALSSGLMLFLYSPESDPSRVYYGTDTRAAALLVGVLLAFGLRHIGRIGQKRAVGLELAGGASLGAVLLALAGTSEFDPALYRGGFLALEVTVAVLIASIVLVRGGLLSRLIALAPLRWLGLRSYSVYLWHWPVFSLTRPGVDIEMPVEGALALRICLTFALAELSYRYVERPVREGALARVWASFRGRHQELYVVRLARWAVAGGLVMMLVAFAAPPLMAARHDDSREYLSSVSGQTLETGGTGEAHDEPGTAHPEAGVGPVSNASRAVETTPTATPSTSTPHPVTGSVPHLLLPTAETQLPTSDREVWVPATATPTHIPSAAPITTVTGTAPPTRGATAVAETERPTPAPQPLLGSSTLVIGDSVMLGAAGEVAKVLPGAVVDAKVARQASSTVSLLNWYRENGRLRPVIIVHIGSNGTLTSRQFDQIMSAIGTEPAVYFINAKVPRKWEASNNKVIAEGVKRYPNARLIDWQAASVGHRDYFAKDGYHLQPKGARAFVALIMSRLQELPSP